MDGWEDGQHTVRQAKEPGANCDHSGKDSGDRKEE